MTADLTPCTGRGEDGAQCADFDTCERTRIKTTVGRPPLRLEHEWLNGDFCPHYVTRKWRAKGE